MPRSIPSNPTSIRNITRFDYNTTSFQGWRVQKSFNGMTFSKYIGDKGRPANISLREAKMLLASLLKAQQDHISARLIKWAQQQGFNVSGNKI